MLLVHRVAVLARPEKQLFGVLARGVGLLEELQGLAGSRKERHEARSSDASPSPSEERAAGRGRGRALRGWGGRHRHSARAQENTCLCHADGLLELILAHALLGLGHDPHDGADVDDELAEDRDEERRVEDGRQGPAIQRKSKGPRT